jgi:hypothetical protein
MARIGLSTYMIRVTDDAGKVCPSVLTFCKGASLVSTLKEYLSSRAQQLSRSPYAPTVLRVGGRESSGAVADQAKSRGILSRI